MKEWIEKVPSWLRWATRALCYIYYHHRKVILGRMRPEGVAIQSVIPGATFYECEECKTIFMRGPFD